jgi:hypothetical protein
LNRNEKRRQEKEQAREAKGLKHVRRHLGESLEETRKIPETKAEMQRHLSGRHTHLYREPMNREERREWDRWWKLKGKGFTKPGKKLRPLEERVKMVKEARERDIKRQANNGTRQKDAL